MECVWLEEVYLLLSDEAMRISSSHRHLRFVLIFEDGYVLDPLSDLENDMFYYPPSTNSSLLHSSQKRVRERLQKSKGKCSFQRASKTDSSGEVIIVRSVEVISISEILLVPDLRQKHHFIVRTSLVRSLRDCAKSRKKNQCLTWFRKGALSSTPVTAPAMSEQPRTVPNPANCMRACNLFVVASIIRYSRKIDNYLSRLGLSVIGHCGVDRGQTISN